MLCQYRNRIWTIIKTSILQESHILNLCYCREMPPALRRNDWKKCLFLLVQHGGTSILSLPHHRPLWKVLYCKRKCVWMYFYYFRLYFFIAFIFWFTFSTNSVQVLTFSLDFLMQWTESFHVSFPPMNQHRNCYWNLCISVSSLGGSATIPWQLRTLQTANAGPSRIAHGQHD